MRPCSLLLVAGLLASLLVSAPSAQHANRKVNAPFVAPPAPVGLASFLNEVVSPDGSRVIFLADPDQSGRLELYGTASDGSTSLVPLSGPLVNGGYFRRVAFTPDSARVIYLAAQESFQVLELYSVPSDGSAPVVKLNGPLATGGNVAITGGGVPFAISPDGSRVVYSANQSASGVIELFSVPSDGSAAPIQLTQGQSSGVSQHAIRADGAAVVFIGGNELFQVPIDGSAAATKLNGPLVANGRVWSFRLTPDGGRVLYSAEQVEYRYPDLYMVALSGGAPLKLNGTKLRDLNWFEATPDGSHVVFAAKQLSAELAELWSVPISGATPALLSVQAIQSQTLRITLDGQRVAYLAFETGAELFSVPIDASSGPVRLNAPLPADGSVAQFQVGGGGRVVYTATQETGVSKDLYSVAADGSSAPVKLNGPLPSGGQVQFFTLEADGMRAVFSTWDVPEKELYSVPIDASAQATVLSDPLVCNDTIYEASLSGGRVVYRYRLDLSGGIEIHSVPVAGGVPPTLLFRPSGTSGAPSDVLAFEFTPDGSKVVYLADPDVDEAVSLFCAKLRGNAAPVRLDPGSSTPCGGDVVSFLLDPSGRYAVFLSDQREDEIHELFRADLEGGTEPVALSVPGRDVVTDAGAYAISPDGTRVVYRGRSMGNPALLSVPLDASSAPILLRMGAVSGSFVISPDSSHVVFLNPISGGTTLHSVPIDGSSTPRQLTPEAYQFEVSPDGQHVVYLADKDRSGLSELYRVPIDGSSPAILLSGENPVGLFKISPDGARVVFNLYGLYSAPIDGSAPPVRISGVPVAGGGVHDFWLSPDGTRAIYLADEIMYLRKELFMVPLDGSVLPERLSPNLVSNGDVVFVTIARDSSRVAFVVDAQVDQVFELYSAPLDGRRPAVKLNPTLAFNGDVEYESMPPRIQADSRGIVYVADQAVNSRLDLYRVALDGSSGSVKLNGPLTGGGDLSVPGFRVSPSGAAVAYAADQEQNDVIELFLSTPGAPTHTKESDPP